MDISGPIEWLTYRWFIVQTWVRGFTVCYDEHDHITAFCKRRKWHWGNHRSDSGLVWNKKWLRIILGEDC